MSKQATAARLPEFKSIPAVRSLRQSEFEQIRKLAFNKFGLDLKHGKEELVSARLGKLIRNGGFATFRDYHDHVVADGTGAALAEMIDALTTNHTSFLREPAHFEFLRTALREEFRGVPNVRIWSAACSSGEEPYSIAFHMFDAGRAPGSFEIFATDISTRALAKAQRAVYPVERFDLLPPEFRKRFLLLGEGQWKGWFKVKPEILRTVEFRRLNLIEPLPSMPPFHVIFCRNVMIYFDRKTQAGLINRLAKFLEPGGYLFVGHSESLNGIDQPLTYCRPAIYRNGPAVHRSRK